MFRSFFSGRARGVLCLGLVTSILLVSGQVSASLKVPADDVPGASDHPMISRFAGSVIAGYQQVDYDAALMPLGPYEKSKPDRFSKVERPEGKLTKIFYIAPEGKSTLEVFHNYQSAMASAGFKTDFSCAGGKGEGGCGGFDFADALVTSKIRGDLDAPVLMGHTLYPVSGDIRYMTAHLARPQGNVDVSLLVGSDERTGVLLQIVESKPMATGQVTVDAKAMSKGLADTGHIALYGIHFATDSATLAADSKETLAQMAELLKANPSLKVYIVGHTDNTGTLAHNLTLSQQRADAVVAALHKSYGIASERMLARGLASFAPLAANGSEPGKALNRRVELVAQ